VRTGRVAQNDQLRAPTNTEKPRSQPDQIGRSVRGYQAIFVPLAAVRSLGYSPLDGQPAVYLYIAALGVIVLNCRDEVRV
jgi:hypothetical protein